MFKYMCLIIVGAYSAPVDDPIRVDLPVYDQPQSASGSTPTAYLANPLLLENSPGDQPQNNDFDLNNLINKKIATSTNVLSNKISSVPGFGIFSQPVTSRENALLETEGFGSKTLSIKENAEKVAAGLFQPKPLVDTIKEEEKYGNTGEKFASTSQAIVNGSARLAKFANTILGVPGNIFRQVFRVATEKLNNVGGKLVGL